MIGNDVVDLLDSEALPGAAHPRFDRRVFASSERQALAGSRTPVRLRWRLWAAKEAAYKAARKIDPRTVFSASRFVVDLDMGLVHHGEAVFALRVEETDAYVHAVVDWVGDGSTEPVPLDAYPSPDATRGCGSENAEGMPFAFPSSRAERGVSKGGLGISKRPLDSPPTRPSGRVVFARCSEIEVPDGRGGGPRTARPTPSAAVHGLALDAIADVLGADVGELSIVSRGRIPFVEHRGTKVPVDLTLSHHGNFVAYAFAVEACA